MEDRPSEYPYPMIWMRWELTLKNGESAKFRIQDATEDMLDMIQTHLFEHFLDDEPLISSQALKDDEESLKDFKSYWLREIKGGVFLVCFQESDDLAIPDKFVGCNVTAVVYRDKPDNFKCKGNAASLINIIMTHMLNVSQPFKVFNVDRYLTASGLSVHKAYRGMGIGVNILKARTKMCKAMGIPMTIAAFTSVEGQAAARHAGFQMMAEMKYSDIESQLPGINLAVLANQTVHLMYKKV